MTAQPIDLTRRLRVLGNQVMRMAAEVAGDRAGPQRSHVFTALARDSDAWLVAAEDMYSERRKRREHFPEGIFGEPSWDILLDLYICEKRGRRCSVTSACIGADAADTTALRHLRELERRGLVERLHDPADRRRRFIRLTEEGYARMTAYISASREEWVTAELDLGLQAVGS